ncbi:MAG TPA: CinA family protein [Anaerolineae bacterium]|nr:CinA family protein [Anaerolineae bacterium]
MDIKTGLEEKVGELMRQKGLKLAVAESCTGGLIAHRITNVPGSSDYFLGGMVTYAYEAKQEWLGVRAETLAKHGVVSRETVLEMARGIRHAFRNLVDVDMIIGLAVSGIAGPSGGTQNKPVGLAWIGLSAKEEDFAWKFQFQGQRDEIKAQSADAALVRLMEYLKP